MRCYASLHELQRHLERIDVENGEYLAWDSTGHPLRLRVQEPVWLDVTSAAERDHMSVHDALNAFAASLGVPPPRDAIKQDPIELHDRLKELGSRRR